MVINRVWATLLGLIIMPFPSLVAAEAADARLAITVEQINQIHHILSQRFNRTGLQVTYLGLVNDLTAGAERVLHEPWPDNYRWNISPRVGNGEPVELLATIKVVECVPRKSHTKIGLSISLNDDVLARMEFEDAGTATITKLVSLIEDP